MFAPCTGLDVWQSVLAFEALAILLCAATLLPALTHGVACRLVSARRLYWGGNAHTTLAGLPAEMR